jgi:hypothetical protein
VEPKAGLSGAGGRSCQSEATTSLRGFPYMDPAPVQRPPWPTQAPARSVSSSGLALLPAAGKRADTVAAHVTYAVRIRRNRRRDRKHVATLARDSAQAALTIGRPMLFPLVGGRRTCTPRGSLDVGTRSGRTSRSSSSDRSALRFGRGTAHPVQPLDLLANGVRHVLSDADR